MMFKKVLAGVAALALVTGSAASAQPSSQGPAPVGAAPVGAAPGAGFLGLSAGVGTAAAFAAFSLLALSLILVVEDNEQDQEPPVSP